MTEQDTLRMIDGEVQAVKENKYNEILGDMYDTISEDQTLDEVENQIDETSMQVMGGYRYHGVNTQFKQVSPNNTRRHWRRRYKMGTRP